MKTDWPISEAMKRCRLCRRSKSVSRFWKRKDRKDGFYSSCKSCEGPRRKREYSRNRSRNRKLKRVAARRFRRRNPEFYKNHYRKNSKRILKKIAVYRAKHPKRFKACIAKWRKANPDKLKSYRSKWAGTPKGRAVIRQHLHNYKARIRGAEGTHTAKEWLEKKREHKFRCARCFRREPMVKLTRDHIIPVSKGGSNHIKNIQPLCGRCNSKKHNKT